MTREEAIERHERIRYNLLNREDKAAVDVAFEALREQDFNANQHVSNTSNALGGWISVEERLPEAYYQDVLVYDEMDACQFIAVLTYKGEWLVPHYEGYKFNITHWMPLPKAPEVNV